MSACIKGSSPKRSVLSTVLLCVLLAFPYRVQATGFPVVDLANLSQSLITVIRSAEQIQHLLTQIQTMEQQLETQLNSVMTFDSSAFDRVHELLNANFETINSFNQMVGSITYSIDSIGAQYDELFPGDTDWSSVSRRDYGDFYQRWDSELSDSAKSAMITQSAVSRVQDNNNEVVRILSSVEGADGEVRQLQATNQLLSVVSNQLSELVNVLSSTGRVAATAAASKAADSESKRHTHDELMNGFTDRGSDVTVPSMPPRMRAN